MHPAIQTSKHLANRCCLLVLLITINRAYIQSIPLCRCWGLSAQGTMNASTIPLEMQELPSIEMSWVRWAQQLQLHNQECQGQVQKPNLKQQTSCLTPSASTNNCLIDIFSLYLRTWHCLLSSPAWTKLILEYERPRGMYQADVHKGASKYTDSR